MSLRDWSVGVWPDLFFVCRSTHTHTLGVCAFVPVSALTAVTVDEAADDECSALHCSISHQPQTITMYCPPAVFVQFPHTAVPILSLIPTELLHSLHTVYVGSMAQ